MRAVILNRIGWCSLMLVLVLATEADAQRRGGGTTRRNRAAESTTPPAADAVVNPATGNSVETPPPPPPTTTGAPLRPDGVGVPVADTPRKSLRVDGISEKNFIKDRVPIPYDHIRSDDEFWEKKIWQVIDIREKMNLPFQYDVEDESGTNQLFINIL
ncbi:MAG TPA: hypothetical protein VJ720_08650, partial [Chitinophaga sp.]|nr:hypothetical protein [Chitinophaga sp.]